MKQAPIEISKAPKDGSKILIACEGHWGYEEVKWVKTKEGGYWLGEEDKIFNPSFMHFYPTHYLPISEKGRSYTPAKISTGKPFDHKSGIN